MFKSLALIAFTAVPVEIVTNPESATQLVGGSTTFNCAASGTPPLNFMWHKDGESAALGAGGSVSISNQSNESSLTLTNIAASDAGAYYCVASNDLAAGRFMSNSTSATLTVHSKYYLCDVFTLYVQVHISISLYAKALNLIWVSCSSCGDSHKS